MVDSGGTQQQYRYDAAGRLVQVLSSGGATLATYSYGAGNQRLMSVEGGVTTCYGWDGGQVIAEYEPSGASGLLWKTGYVYLGGRLLATTNAGGTRFHHPDRLGTNVVTDQSNGELVTKQMGLPYGTQQPSGAFGGDNSWQHSSKTNPSRQRFTSYDRSGSTGLDYAVNRHYSSAQGRFTQVDPIGMSAVSLGDPQSLNLYAYCGNDPVNRLDPDGLFWGKLFGWIGKVVKWVAIAVTVAIAVLTVIPAAWAGVALGKLLVFLAAHKTIAGILGLGGITGSFGTPTTFPNGSGVGGVTSFLEPQQKSRTFGSFLTQANEEILNASLKLAEKALKKPGCKTLIAGAVSNDPAKLLAKLKASNQLREGNLMKLIGRQAGGVTDGYGEDAYITFDDYFFFKDPRVGMRTALLKTSAEYARSVTVLHELSHATGKFTHPGFKADYKGTSIGGEDLDKIIYQTCFQEQQN